MASGATASQPNPRRILAEATVLATPDDRSPGDRPIEAARRPAGDHPFGRRELYGAVLLAFGYYAGVHAGLALTFPSSPVAVLWPPNAVLLAALLLTPPRRWWLLIAAVIPAHFAAEIPLGVPLAMAAPWLVSNVTEAVLGAAIIRRFLREPPRFDRLHDLWVFLAGAMVIAPVVSSFLDAAFVALVGWRYSDFWQVWRIRLFSNALAALIVVPAILVWARTRLDSLRRASPARVAEAVLLLGALVLTSTAVFHGLFYHGELTMHPYLPVVVLIWAAVRFGVHGVTLGMAVVAAFAITGVVEGRGPFAASNPVTAAFGSQTFLIIAGFSLLLLASSLAELRQARRVAASREESLNLALNAAAMGTWEWDFAADLITWHSARTAADTSSPSSRSTSPAGLLRLAYGSDRESLRRAMQVARNDRHGIAEIECRFGNGGGGPAWITAKGCVQDGRNGTRRMIGVFIDNTDRKSQETEARTQREQLAHLGRVSTLGELSGAIAHELNQPLTAILINAQAALRELEHEAPSRRELVEMMDDIVSEDKRAGAVIRRLRTLLLRGSVETQPVDVNECIEDVLGLERTDLVANHVVTRLELEPGLPRVNGDRVQLLQVLLNLVVNARDAMMEIDADSRSLSIVTTRADGNIHIKVCDTGRGVHDTEAIFAPFFSTKDHGIGMGLAICRTIVSAHGGWLWARNNPDRGATFHISLPAHGVEGAAGRPRRSSMH